MTDDYTWVMLLNGDIPHPDRRLLKAAVDNHPARRVGDVAEQEHNGENDEN